MECCRMGQMIVLRAILAFSKIVSEYKFPRFKIRRIVYRRIRRVFYVRKIVS